MWWGSSGDPGGSEGPSKEPPQNQQLLDLQEQFDSQQTLIAQLKEMLKKSEHSSSVSREKVEEYASTFSKMNARAKRSKFRKGDTAKMEDETGTTVETGKELGKKASVSTPAKEKVNLLRQQLEENRLKLAQRDKNQKGIEEMVNQLKAQLDDSQIMISQSTINLPKVEMTQVTPVSYTTETPKEDLVTMLQNKDKQIEELNNRVQQLQGNVLDLQENLKEKDSVIDARTKAITLLSENLSKKGKNTLDMLDETKEQMRSMQEQFVMLETKMKDENAKLNAELNGKNKEIEELRETNNRLSVENSNLELSSRELQQQLEVTSTELSDCKQKLIVTELKIEDLTKINQELEGTVSELRNRSDESSVERTERSASSSPQRGGRQKSKNWKKGKQRSVMETSSETEHLNRIAELEKLIEELNKEKQQANVDESEVESLKKQLETMNKNLIKTKAQYKAKLKDLQKKSTPGDSNEKVLNLESDNVKLEQRIAELEEEKGNLQLRLVDFDVNKDKERIADLENRIEEQKMEIENHIRSIRVLETQITDKSNEISSLRNELANLMHIENAQVCSEITSVQLEEQLDKELNQKKEIKDKYEAIIKENENLLEKIEELNKEKQEMNTKLVNYMQENMELIDRLEKSSTEKVSSAESIEIVESLTQQEKLEIEAYQKSLSEFVPDKETIEQADMDSNLNESVNKLSEDSSELLERIELFTVERREVMDKMDLLLCEKEHLLEKLDSLEKEKSEIKQKFDDLCTEKHDLVRQIEFLSQSDVTDGIRMDSSSNTALVEEYKTLVDNQKIEIEALKQEISRIEENTQTNVDRDNLMKISQEKEALEVIISSLNEQIVILHQEYKAFFNEHENLKQELKKNSEKVHEKDDIEKDYNLLQQKLVEFEQKVSVDAQEIMTLQSVIEENKNELINSADYIANLTNELSVKHSELTSYRSEIDHLNNIIQQLNAEIENKNQSCDDHIETIDFLSKQLQELKVVMNDNFRELQKYEELDTRIAEAEQLIEIKDSEIIQLRKEKSACDSRIISLETEMKHKDEHFSQACQQLKEKCVSLESKIQANTGSLEDIKEPFEAKIRNLELECQKLEVKHKEHVEKMKKIAANLKKKVHTCQELEAKLAEVTEKWENECKEKSDKEKLLETQHKALDDNKNKINSLIEQLKEVEIEFKDLQTKFSDKNTEYGHLKIEFDNAIHNFEHERLKLQHDITEYKAINDNLQSQNTNYQHEIEKLQTKTNDTIVNDLLQQIEALQVNFETTKNALEAKIQEKDLCIENLETETTLTREKLVKLHEGLSQVEERRQSLEKRAFELGEQLEAKETACEEASISENLLEKRLAALISHDEAIEKKLKEFTITNQTLGDKIDNLMEENLALMGKLADSEHRLKEKEVECDKISGLESDSMHLREIIASLEQEIKKIHSEYEKRLLEKVNEIENMEIELNNQVDDLNNQRKAAINHCEKLEERIQEYSDNEQIINNEVSALNQKLLDIKTDLDKRVLENQQLCETNTTNLLIIEQLKTQLSEVERLQQIITEKETEIMNYQRQNMEIQTSNVEDTTLQKQLHDLTNELKVIEKKKIELETINAQMKHVITHLNTQLEQRLVRQTAEEYIDEIITSAQHMVAETPIEKASVEKLESGVRSKEKELLEKIKALEFMLYSVEKEKDDAVSQCHGLSNELTRLVYEREALMGKTKDPPKTEVDLSQLESQIMIEDPTNEETKREIRSLEFSPTKISVESTEAVVEDVIQPKTTYICYADDKKQPGPSSGTKPFEYMPAKILFDNQQSVFDDLIRTETTEATSGGRQSSTLELPHAGILFGNKQPIVEDLHPQSTSEAKKPSETLESWGTEDDILRKTLESQIIKDSDIPLSSTDKRELQLFEYEPVNLPQAGPSRKTPVDERITDPKSAYLCYPDDNAVDMGDAFAGEEDGWGWNAEEVKLEVKHQQSLNYAPVHDEKTQKINDLETEKAKLLEDIKAQQIKSAKLIKKLKELKAKNDNLTTQLKQNSNLDSLDMAIQDELNLQIKTLETNLKELNDEKVKEKAEKDNLLKRIDMLTAANERMVEMKEKQDSEIGLLNFNNRQLSTKLEQMEWGVDSPKKDVIPETGSPEEIEALNKKIKELNSTINELTIDNEEMQLLLEEQRNLRLEMQGQMKSEQEYSQLKHEKDTINSQLLELTQEKAQMTEKLIHLSTINYNDLCPRLNDVQTKINDLFMEKDRLAQEYAISLEELQSENKKLQEQINNIVLEVETTAEQSKEILETELRLRISELEFKLTEKETDISELNNLIIKLTADKSELEIKLREISGVICAENADQLEGLGEKLEIIVREVQEKNKEVSELNSILNLERAEFEQKLTITLEQLGQEWAQRVEQRGSDVAESWKLHLEARESEFMQLEQNLRLELTEIYNKNETISLENSELQKKVDLLMQEKQVIESDNKNETLQILSERQSEIITLTQQLQDVSVQLEVKTNEIISLQQIIDTIQKQNHEMVEKNKELHTEYKNYEHLNKELKNEVNDLKKLAKQNEELNAQLQIENQEIEILKQNVEGLRQELSRVREEGSVEKNKATEADSRVKHLEEITRKEELKLQEIIKDITGEVVVYDDVYDYIEQLGEEIVQIHQKQHDLLLVKDQLANEKVILEETIAGISNSVSNYKESNESLSKEISDLREANRGLEIDLNESAQARNVEINDMNTQIQEIESKYLAQLQDKQLAIESLAEQVDTQTKHLSDTQKTLDKKSSEALELKSKLNELNVLSSEESAQMDELRQLIEQQTAEIEELKQEIEQKTQDYNAVSAELDTMTQFYQKQEKHVHFKEPISDTEPAPNVEVVSRAELDIAHYMLHQRDVRCEELTVELMQLLEERDTLQLRLSNAIRINEELRGKLSPQKIDLSVSDEMNTPKVLQTTGAIPKSKSSDIVLKATGTELATEATEMIDKTTENKQELDNKLSQLRSVGYRDKTLKDDQEIRYLQQMSIMQQHRDLVSRLPPEAAAQLVDASYTLSRDVQSPSKVLLNWLWGKSTPKVDDV